MVTCKLFRVILRKDWLESVQLAPGIGQRLWIFNDENGTFSSSAYDEIKLSNEFGDAKAARVYQAR
jgi:hypothetical protein